MRELILRGAIATILEVFKTPHLLEPIKPALLKTFQVIWGEFSDEPAFQAVVGKTATAKAASGK